MNLKNFKFSYKYLAGAAALGLLFSVKKIVFKVEPGYTALKFNIFSGVGSKLYREGYHLLVPYVERSIIYDCRMKNNHLICVCGTKGKDIVLSRFTNYNIKSQTYL